MNKSPNVVVTPFGPIPKYEGALQKKARLLQGYYRQEILQSPMGTGPTEQDGQNYCNMLVDGEKHGRNFLTQEIFEYAKFRCRDKRNIETIEEFRLFNNMLSSQPMCFNLFVPLRSAVREGKEFVTRVFQSVLPQLKISKIINIEIEYIPIPIEEYIDDKTAFDAFVEYRTKSWEKGCIAIETKYVDSLGKNNPKNMKRKLEVAQEVGCFTPDGLNLITANCPQIVRNFLLTEKYRLNHSFSISHSIMLALNEDKESGTEIQKLKNVLRPEFQSKIEKISLEDFAQAVRDHCPTEEIAWIENLRRRYLDMKKAAELAEAVVRRVVGFVVASEEEFEKYKITE